MAKEKKLELGCVEVGSNIAHNHSSSQYEVISGHYCPNTHAKLTKSEISEVGVCSKIAQNHSP